MEQLLSDAPLGKKVRHSQDYDPSYLFSITRQQKRDEIQVPSPLPFHGVDIWNAFELSWLNPRGRPSVALAEIVVPCQSPKLFESKSFKLYLNSFNQTVFPNTDIVVQTISQDLAAATGSTVKVNVIPPSQFQHQQITEMEGVCLDDLDVRCDHYQPDANLLTLDTDASTIVSETVYSHLLKSNCLVTNQPDWATVQIHYEGRKINYEALLRYIISFRNHNEFHEQCVERMFMDISRCCQPKKLSVYARYTRRGGVDINPFRSSESLTPENTRTCRQ